MTLLCGYCPRKFVFEGPWQKDETYLREARMHEAYGPRLDSAFVKSPDGQVRPPRKIKDHGVEDAITENG